MITEVSNQNIKPARKINPSILILIFGVIWIGVTAVINPVATGGGIPAPKEGFHAPDFEGTDLEGNSIRLSDFKGIPVIINIWATWCGPCQAEMPALQKIYTNNKDIGLKILAINSTVQDDSIRVRTFINEKNLTFTVVFDPDGKITRRYNVQALPSTFFVGRDGIIQKIVLGGPMSESFLSSTVNQLTRGGGLSSP